MPEVMRVLPLEAAPLDHIQALRKEGLGFDRIVAQLFAAGQSR